MTDPRIMLDEMVAEYQATADSFDRDDHVRLLCDLRELRAGLAAFAADVTKDLLAHADEKRWVTPGLGEVQIRKQTKRSEWDNEGLTRKLVALALDERVLDDQTGEYEAAHEAVARVLSECSRPSWRLTPLRERHVPIDEYCVERDDGYGVELPPRRDA